MQIVRIQTQNGPTYGQLRAGLIYPLAGDPFVAGASAPPFVVGASAPPFVVGASAPPFVADASAPPFVAGASAPPFVVGASAPPFVADASAPPFADPPLALDDVRLLPPCQPSKIVCIGRNYAAHAAEHQAEVPAEPLIFLKPPSALLAPGQPIRLPPLSARVEHEAELVVVIGRRCRHLPAEQAASAIFGYTCGNDVTARDLQRRDGQWARAKGFDTFCPLGPWIETDLDPSQVEVTCLVNGQQRQHGHGAQLIFSIPQLIAAITAVMTLEPGDIIMTGTPAGVGPLQAGDQVTVHISGIGALHNPVVAS